MKIVVYFRKKTKKIMCNYLPVLSTWVSLKTAEHYWIFMQYSNWKPHKKVKSWMSSRSQALVYKNKIYLKILWYEWTDSILPLRKNSISLSHFWECLCMLRSNWITQISVLVLSPFWSRNSSNKAGTQMAEGEFWPGKRKLNQPIFPHQEGTFSGSLFSSRRRWS